MTKSRILLTGFTSCIAAVVSCSTTSNYNAGPERDGAAMAGTTAAGTGGGQVSAGATQTPSGGASPGGTGPASGTAGASGSAAAGAAVAGGGMAGGAGAGTAQSGTGGDAAAAGDAPAAGTAGDMPTVGGMGGQTAAGGTGAAAGMDPAGGTGGGSMLSPEMIIISDDFDAATSDGPPDETLWEPYEEFEATFAPVVDGSKSHSPPNSVRVTSTSSGRGSFLVPLMGFPTADNSFYVRVFINWAQATSMISGHSGFIVAAGARDNSATELRLGISSKSAAGVAMLDLNLQNPSDGGGETTRYSNGFTDGADPVTEPGFEFDADVWYCLEAFFNGAGHEFRVWVDEVEIENMHVTDFAPREGDPPRDMWAPTYNFLKIGAQDYDANLGEIWYDDVTVATERVGCN